MKIFVSLLIASFALTGCANTQQSKYTDGKVVDCSKINSAEGAGVELLCVGDSSITNFDSLRGPMILNVWGTWCAPCKEELPLIRKFHDSYIDQVKPLFWFGEYDELEKPAYGQVFDASYTWTWMHRAKDFYQQKWALDSLNTVLNRYDQLGDSTFRAWFTTNHDENSWNGTEYEKYGEMARALAVFSITWNGVPLIYSGQEMGNRKRILFFEKDLFERGPDADYLQFFYTTLTRLKKTHPALHTGDPAGKTYRIKTTAPEQVFAFLRKNGQKEVLVVLNLSGQNNLHFDLIDPMINGIYQNVFSGAANDFKMGTPFEMQAWEYLVYEK